MNSVFFFFSLLTCFILYSFGAPIIKGFAVTLALGVLLSMLTAVTVSRTLMRLFVSTKFGSSPGRYRVKIVQPEKGKTV